MKTKLGLIILVGVGLAGSPVFAYERDKHRDDNRNEQHGDRDRHNDNDRNGDNDQRGDWWKRHRGELQRNISRMNKMLAPIKWELSRYKGDWRIRREVDRISDEVRRVNWRFENRRFRDRDEFNDHVKQIRWKLHNIEERLHVRKLDFFRWE